MKTLRKYLSGFEKRDNILRSLGVIGWDNYERAMESLLLLGGSILLVGSHGEGKSMLAKRLGAALGVPMAKYDASKSVWEDIIGFPDPAKLMDLDKRGNIIGIPRIETPTSIWGKRLLLIDEINRATPELQSKWLEVILDQTLMGEPTGAKWIISAMNPGYAGTNPLDLALVSRYMYFIQAPSGVRMPDEDILDILSIENTEEIPAVPTWLSKQLQKNNNASTLKIEDTYLGISETTVDKLNEASSKLKAILFIAADALKPVTKRWEAAVNDYIVCVVKSLFNESKQPTDPRRMRMMKNALLSCISLEIPVKDISLNEITAFNVQDLALQVLYMSYPLVAGVDSPTREQLQNTHIKSADLLEDKSSPIYAISIETDPLKKLILLFKYEDRDPILTYKILNSVLTSDGGYNAYVIAYCLFDLYKDGFPLDAQCLSIISNTLSGMFSKFQTPVIIPINSRNDQLNVWNLLTLLSKETFIENSAAQIASIFLGETRGNKNTTTGNFLTEFDTLYKEVLNTFTTVYNQLKEILPYTIKKNNNSSQEEWEEYLGEETTE